MQCHLSLVPEGPGETSPLHSPGHRPASRAHTINFEIKLHLTCLSNSQKPLSLLWQGRWLFGLGRATDVATHFTREKELLTRWVLYLLASYPEKADLPKQPASRVPWSDTASSTHSSCLHVASSLLPAAGQHAQHKLSHPLRQISF